MARITGYGQSGRIEWDRPVESYFPHDWEGAKAYMSRMLANSNAEEVELTRRIVSQNKSSYFQAFPGPLSKDIYRKDVAKYLATRKELFDINSIFDL